MKAKKYVGGSDHFKMASKARWSLIRRRGEKEERLLAVPLELN
jgi:hypothetical protein